MVEARTDPGQGDEDEQQPEIGGRSDEHGPDPQDDDAEGQEPSRIAVVRHRSEDDLKEGGDQQGCATQEAGLEGAERESGLEDRDLAGDDGHGAVVGEVVNRIGEKDPSAASHAVAMAVRLKSLGLRTSYPAGVEGTQPNKDPAVRTDPCDEGHHTARRNGQGEYYIRYRVE